MNRLARISILLIAAASTAFAVANPPNIILVMTDDQGYGDIAAHGNPWIRTPNLDRLHGESVRFTQFHVDPTCSPSRSALMTGRYSTRTGCWHTIMGRSLIFHDEVLLPQILKENGYRTGVFGKWHLGDNYPMRPMDRGFEDSVVHGGGGIGQTPDWWGNDYYDDTYWRNGEPESFEGYCTTVFFDEAIRFIDAAKDQPFFLYLPTNVPHFPYYVDESYTQHYMSLGVPRVHARFYGMIEQFDEQLGRLRTHLRQAGLEDNTVFIFMTDNGTAEGIARADATDDWKGFNADMRGKKGSQYDGGHRVPFFIRWPAGEIGGGLDVDRLSAHFDVLPTLMDLCGIQVPKELQLDGKSLVPLIRNPQSDWPDRTLFAHVQRQEIPPKWIRSTAMTQRWRLVDGEALYDITTDPGQTTDVAQDFPQIVSKLRADYEQWWTTLEPSFKKYGYITIGSEQENPSRITAHDWHSDMGVPWDQGHVPQDRWFNGYWMIEVARAGEYEFNLYRHAKEMNRTLEASLARLRIGDAEFTQRVEPAATSVAFSLQLPKGATRLQTWLIDETSGNSRGAYFVEARHVSEE